MTPSLQKKLWDLAAPANPTEAQMKPIIDGWDELFLGLGLRMDEQENEFDAIMRARVAVGVISIVPDRVVGCKLARLGGAYMPLEPFGAKWWRSESAPIGEGAA